MRPQNSHTSTCESRGGIMKYLRCRNALKQTGFSR